MTHLRTTRFTRHGMTLIELLVVVGILSIMMGIAAVAVRTGTQGKKQREAARQINAFVAGAQARAFELGRPCGFEIVRHGSTLEGNPNAGLLNNVSFRMYMLESPPVYAGDFDHSRLQFMARNVNELTFADVTVGALGLSAASAQVFMQPGETGEVRFNYRGEKYPFVVDAVSPLRIIVTVPQSDRTFDYFVPGATQVPFQLHLRPTRSSVTPLQLPSDMCIDLAFSGMGASAREFHNSNLAFGAGSSVKVMFSPTGSIDRIYDNNGFARRPIGNVHLLVGKYNQAVNLVEVEAALDPTDLPAPLISLIDNSTNVYDGTSMWVSVNYLTGQVTTTRNGVVYQEDITANSWGDAGILAQARRFAQRVLTIKGQGDE